MEARFIEFCKEGKLEEAKKIHDNPRIEIQPASYRSAFIKATVKGHIGVLKWLVEQDENQENINNLHNAYGDALKISTHYRYNAIIEWIEGLDKTTQAQIDDARTLGSAIQNNRNGGILIEKYVVGRCIRSRDYYDHLISEIIDKY